MSRIPKLNNEYLKYLELNITALEKVEQDEIHKRPTVAKVISSSLDFLRDYRDEIKYIRRRRGE
jgi:hypothetical protein